MNASFYLKPRINSHQHGFFKRVLRRYFELSQLTIFSESPVFTLLGMLLCIAKFKIVMERLASENDTKTSIQTCTRFSVP